MLRYDGYIRDLNKMNEFLQERKRKGWRDGVDYLLVQAAELACASLNHLLVEDDFWEWMKQNNSNSISKKHPDDFDGIVVPVNTEVLRKAGYIGPPEPEHLLYEARKAIEEGKAGKVAGNVEMVQTKIEDLTSIVCGYAGRAKGVLSAFPNNRESAVRDKKLWKRLNDRFPARKVIKVIIDTVTIISGVVTILAYVEAKKEQEKRQPLPVEFDEQSLKVEQFWGEYYMYGVPDRKEEKPDTTALE